MKFFSLQVRENVAIGVLALAAVSITILKCTIGLA